MASTNTGTDANSPSPFLYDAFISYRHTERDRAWAEWLLEAIEGYRVPWSLQTKGFPARFSKVFRDEDEMPASGDLNDQIKRALAASKFLIVVCSPYTPRSKWVEREIELFKELGRGDQILALLTEGEPFDSFPTALLARTRVIQKPDGTNEIVREDTEPLAADVRPRKGVSPAATKQQALLRLAACLLGVSYDTLRQREQERRRRAFLINAAAASVLLFAAGGGGVAYWDYTRPKSVYYSGLVWKFGVPVGIGPIEEEARRHRAVSYRVTTVRGKVTDVRRENGSGSLQVVGGSESRWVVRYSDDGKPERVAVFDRGNRLLYEQVLQRGSRPDRMIVTFERDNIPVAQTSLRQLTTDDFTSRNRAGGGPSDKRGRAEITRHEVTFDTAGHAVNRTYQDPWGTPRQDAGGSFGEVFAYSPEGIVVRRSQLGPDGSVMSRMGVAATIRTLDGAFNIVKESLQGPNGEAVIGPDGYAATISSYDRWGNETSRSYVGLDDKPVNSRGGFARVDIAFDARGNTIAESYFDADGKPTLTDALIARQTGTYDDRGNLIERAVFGARGEPVVTRGGFHKSISSWDQNNVQTGIAYFGIDGKPTTAGAGAARVAYDHDSEGRFIQVAYFDADGKPMDSREGVARMTREWDAQSNLVAESYFGTDGKPTRLKRGGLARLERRYDNRRNLIEETYKDVDGSPVASTSGTARRVYTYDSRGNQIAGADFGIDGRPAINSNGFARFTASFDERGNLIEYAYFGVDDLPILANGGCARFRYRADTVGNLIETRCFGTDGQPRIGSGGFARRTTTYDGRNNPIEFAYFGTADEPVNAIGGSARLVQTFDARDRLTSARFFEAAGREVVREVALIKIKPGMQAERLGLKPADRLLAVDGQRLFTVPQTQDIIRLTGFGVRHELRVRRGSAELTFAVEPGELGVEMRLLAPEENPDSALARAAAEVTTTADP